MLMIEISGSNICPSSRKKKFSEHQQIFLHLNLTSGLNMQSNNLYLFLKSALQICLRANKQCLVFNRSILHPQAAEFV